jgi:hypothetical protein
MVTGSSDSIETRAAQAGGTASGYFAATRDFVTFSSGALAGNTVGVAGVAMRDRILSAARDAQAIPTRDDASLVSQQRDHVDSPWRGFLETALTAGSLPRPLVSALLTMIDDRQPRALRSQAANDANEHLQGLEDAAFLAGPFMAQTRAMESHLRGSIAASKRIAKVIQTQLQTIYKDPKAAWSRLTAILHNPRYQTGEVVRRLGERPDLLGPLNGANWLSALGFPGKQYEASLAAVGGLVQSIRDRAGAKQTEVEDQRGLADLRMRPDREPALRASIEAHGQVASLQAALINSLGDPITPLFLSYRARDLGLQASAAEVQSVEGLSPAYRQHLLDQVSRRDEIQYLQAALRHADPIACYQLAKVLEDRNKQAAEQLYDQDFPEWAETAEEWRRQAKIERIAAAERISSTTELKLRARENGILPEVMAYLRDGDAQDTAQGGLEGLMGPAARIIS